MAKKKTVKVDFHNPEAHMKLTVKGEKAGDQALTIMQTFDKTCKKIREREKQESKTCYIENSYLTGEEADLHCSKQDSCEDCKYFHLNYPLKELLFQINVVEFG